MSQWLKIILSSESVQGDSARLLCRSGAILLEEGNLFSGTGWLIFTANGKIKELHLGDADSILISENALLASDITINQEDLSTVYLHLVKVSGPGRIFISGGGDFIEYFLEIEETAEVRTSSIIALDNTISFQIGSQFSSLTGPGAVLLTSIIETERKHEAPEKGFSLFDQL
ncbi:MAG: AIM24 family protein [Theionarchaea archaeon]|nr:AIM24 family protein [Theionarchaea archaeon]